MAGHSKWSNIRHIKAAKDAQKVKVTTKCVQMIKMAVKEGGGSADPKLNSKLARVLEYARSQNVTAASIASTLKQSQKSQDNAKSMMLYYRAPGGLLMLVEVFTDNLTQTRHNIQSIIKKTSFQETTSSIRHVFDEKGVVVAVAGEGKELPTLEEALELAIELGAEEVEEEKNEEGKGGFVFTCSPDVFLEVKKGVEDVGYHVTYSNIDFIPNAPVPLQDEDRQTVELIMEKLEGIDQVMRMHVNL